jgi:hypothetical protein
MYDIENYDTVFKQGKYSPALVNEIQSAQHTLGGRTFFERLLELLGIKCPSHTNSPP